MLIDRYLLREVSLPFIGVSSALLLVFLTYSITAFLAKASGGLLNPGEIAHLTFLKSVIALEVLLPMGCTWALSSDLAVFTVTRRFMPCKLPELAKAACCDRSSCLRFRWQS